MKKDISNLFEEQQEVVREILKHVETLKSSVNVNRDQNFKTSILPIISNHEFSVKNRIIENERWETIRTLALTLEPVDFYRSINQLNYSLK